MTNSVPLVCHETTVVPPRLTGLDQDAKTRPASAFQPTRDLSDRRRRTLLHRRDERCNVCRTLLHRIASLILKYDCRFIFTPAASSAKIRDRQGGRETRRENRDSAVAMFRSSSPKNTRRDERRSELSRGIDFLARRSAEREPRDRRDSENSALISN